MIPPSPGEDIKKDITGASQEKDVERSSDSEVDVEFSEVKRSNKLVENPGGTPVSELYAWENYTIIIREKGAHIEIYDENLEPVDFPSPLSDLVVDVYWSSDTLKSKLGSTVIKQDGYTQLAGKPISSLPVELAGFARAKMGSSSHMNYQGSGKASYLVDSLVPILDKYILLTDKEFGYFSAFVTKSEAGVTLAPKDWKRLTPKDNIPADLVEEAKNVLSENAGYKRINETLFSMVTDVGINIFKIESSHKTLEFSDLVPSIKENIISDPSNPNVIYYCQTSSPADIRRLDLSGEPGTWKSIVVKLPNRYSSIRNLQLDPTGNFFIFYSNEDFVMLAKDTLEEVKREEGLKRVKFDSSGRIRAIDKDGNLVMYEANFDDLAAKLKKQRILKVAQGMNIGDIFDQKELVEAQINDKGLEYLDPLRDRYKVQFEAVLANIGSLEELSAIQEKFDQLRAELRQQGLKPNEVLFVIEGLEEPITAKKKEFAAQAAQKVIDFARSKLDSGLTINSLSEARDQVNKIKAVEALLEAALLEEVRAIAVELEQRTIEFFKQRGEEITKDIDGLVAQTRTELDGFTTKSQMDDWLEFRYPKLKSKLGSLAKDVPLEATDAYNFIINARSTLGDIAAEYEHKFKVEYAQVREKAVGRIQATIDMLNQDIDGLIDRLQAKNFDDRTLAEQYLDSSEAQKAIKLEIAGLTAMDPDAAKMLERDLKIKISNALTEIERGALNKVSESGQQMVLLGKELFPKWEARVKKKEERRFDLVFQEDKQTHGPRIHAHEILGDVSLSIVSQNESSEVRLFENWEDENNWRFGLSTYRGQDIPPSYVTAGEFKQVRNEYADWSRENSNLKRKLQKKKVALREIYSRREKPLWRLEDGKKVRNKRDPSVDGEWRKECEAALEEYATFVNEHKIILLRRIDEMKTEPEVEYTNGKGFVPKWQSHWTMDLQTVKDLEKMADAFKMQLDLQADITNLKGHAGTGKDVRIKMFCALTNRPYFGIDCTKWTTEFELSEDVMLESVDGASETLKVPSAVLNGITTPGAVVYFNEFNAMPEQAQIFLHALMDEKRSLTLKTSSGKVIKALPSVILASSMNPGYPGTFAPQFATKSRMVSLDIGYPPLTREPADGDPNTNPVYDSSEALRIARGIDSLADLTYEASLERNEFVKMWDSYVNGIDNGSPELTGTQKFDIETLLALVHFTEKLREGFIRFFEKTSKSRKALLVPQPITGRELRRCAYGLSKMTPEEKVTANPEQVARDLIRKYFVSHIDGVVDRDAIITSLQTWTSKKRVRI